MEYLKKAALGITTATAFIAPILAQSSYSTSTSTEGDPVVGLIILCCTCVFIFFFLGLNIYLTVDAMNRDYGTDDNQKIVGIILIWLLGFPIGILLYYFLIMSKYPKKS